MGAGGELFAKHRGGHEVPVEIGLSPVEVDGKSFILSTIINILAALRDKGPRGASQGLGFANNR